MDYKTLPTRKLGDTLAIVITIGNCESRGGEGAQRSWPIKIM